ncbi:hypothetical protein [Streptomyces odonnellii]|uniref:hypothetical protein n=1 Tax=Streptomyces odonnellii TaxID=1417980 RepID=UPI000626DA50|nr:hypothetical protein [Streptomyces odonnellii]
MSWATTTPDKRRALAQLQLSDDITEQSRHTAGAACGGIVGLLERSRANGPIQDAPLSFLLVLMNAIADAAMDTMIREPDQASRAYCGEGRTLVRVPSPV